MSHLTAHPRGCTRPHHLVKGHCVCWGLVLVVDWEIGTQCSRCGETFITEAEYLERRAALKQRATRAQVVAVAPRLKPMHQRPTATVATGETL